MSVILMHSSGSHKHTPEESLLSLAWKFTRCDNDLWTHLKWPTFWRMTRWDATGERSKFFWAVSCPQKLKTTSSYSFNSSTFPAYHRPAMHTKRCQLRKALSNHLTNAIKQAKNALMWAAISKQFHQAINFQCENCEIVFECVAIMLEFQ